MTAGASITFDLRMSGDKRRIRISAPPDGRSADPPPRRRPQVVRPDDGPRSGGPGPASEHGSKSGSSVFDSSPALPGGIASPPSASLPPRRVRVAAPGDGPTGPPPSDKVRRPPSRDAGPTRPIDEGGPTDPDASGFNWKRVRRVALGVFVVLALLFGGGVFWSYQKFQSIETVDLSSVLSSGSGTNYLIVGTDSRDGIDEDNSNAGAILGDNTVGMPQRSDTIMILRIDGEGTHTMSVPRDLYVTIAETGDHGKINASFLGGPQRLIATLTDQLGLPIHHYMEIDLAAFEGMVDALGGITIDFPYAAYDNGSGLNITEPGSHNLDGSQALAYVRARKYHQVIDGQDVPDGLGDLNRVVRQQEFLSAVGAKIGSTRNPFKLKSTADALASGIRIDSDMSFFDALGLVRRMRNLNAEPIALPVDFGRAGAASIVNLIQPEADEVLARFGSPGANVT